MNTNTRFLGIGILASCMALCSCGNDEESKWLPLPIGGDSDRTVNISIIPGVIVPVRDAFPVNTTIETEQYLGYIFWTPGDTPFAATTVYTANVFLTGKAGFTLNGVPANFFTVAGATTVTNSENSGNVTAVFPATAAAEDIDVAFLGATQTGGVSAATASTGLYLSFDKSPATLTADNITVTGATKGTLVGPGTTMYLAISNITVANGATVSVTITSPAGYSVSGSPKTAVVYRPPYVGLAYGGGIVFYVFQPGDPGYVSGETHGLIVSPNIDHDQSSGIVWATPANQNVAVPGGTDTALGTGQANTINIIAQNGPGIAFAAGIARAYHGGGYTDWYLPSWNELTKLYSNNIVINFFPWTQWYWSSSQDSAGSVRALDFWYGEYWTPSKSNGLGVRAIRSF